MKKSEINVEVQLDENQIPETIQWQATSQAGWKECRAMLLSVWDPNANETLRIDLWTKEMRVDEMKMFMHQSILTMADTFEKATGEKEMALTMRDFCDYFAEKMGLKPEGDQ
jgi:gliding motility-associated protein GldC